MGIPASWLRASLSSKLGLAQGFLLKRSCVPTGTRSSPSARAAVPLLLASSLVPNGPCEQGFSCREMGWSGHGMPPRHVPRDVAGDGHPTPDGGFRMTCGGSAQERWQTRPGWGAALGAKSHRGSSLAQGMAVSPADPSPSPRGGVGAVPRPWPGQRHPHTPCLCANTSRAAIG